MIYVVLYLQVKALIMTEVGFWIGALHRLGVNSGNNRCLIYDTTEKIIKI